jgi:hypothetical protein
MSDEEITTWTQCSGRRSFSRLRVILPTKCVVNVRRGVSDEDGMNRNSLWKKLSRGARGWFLLKWLKTWRK